MSFSNKSLIKIFLASSLVFASITIKQTSENTPANASQDSHSSSQSSIFTDSLKISLFQTDNKVFATRIEALNAVKDRGLFPYLNHLSVSGQMVMILPRLDLVTMCWKKLGRRLGVTTIFTKWELNTLLLPNI
jgi:hypothetical protein